MSRGNPGMRRGRVRHLETALEQGPEAVIEFAWCHSIPEPNSGCWLWLGPTNNAYYGWLRDPRKSIDRTRANRVQIPRLVCEAKHGAMANDIVTRHSCDVPLCVNPDHLQPGTKADNFHDAMRRFRWEPNFGERNGRTKLTWDDVLAIRLDNTTASAMAETYDVSRSLIHQIRRGVIWAET